MDNNSWMDEMFSDLLLDLPRKTPISYSDRSFSLMDNKCNGIQCWSQLFVPTNYKDRFFVVNKRKVNECRDIILKNLNTPTLIIFTGPCGCGKLTTLNVVCHEENITYMEWSPLSQYNVYNNNNEETNLFNQFENIFYEWLILTTNSNSSDRNLITTNRLFVLRGIPNIFLKEINRFIDILRSKLILLHVPIVILCENSFDYSNFCKKLSNGLGDKYSVEIINFKPITTNNLIKYGTTLMKQFKTAKSYQLIPKDIIHEIATYSCGDIRNFILELQFRFLSQRPSKERKRQASFCTEPNNLIIQPKLKDERLTLYHSVGKVLYCKRHEIEDDKVYLPIKFLHLYRRKSEVDITDLLHRLICDYDIFSSTLFENVYHFIPNLNDLTNLYDDMCTSDVLSSYWSDNLTTFTDIQHSAIFLLVQCILFWRAHQHNTTKQSFHSFIIPTRSLLKRYVGCKTNILQYNTDPNMYETSMLRNISNQQRSFILDGFTNLQQYECKVKIKICGTQSYNDNNNNEIGYSDSEKIDTDTSSD